MPISFWIRFSSTWRFLRSFRSRAPSGSSSSSTFGRLTTARASATRCCWPPESWLGLRFASPQSPTRSSSAWTRRSTSALSTPLALEAVGDVVADAHVREQRVALEDRVRRPLVRRAARRRRTPSIRTWPSSGCSKPAIIRRVVVLPQPIGPSRVKNSPLADVEVEVVDRGEVAEALAITRRLTLGLPSADGRRSDCRCCSPSSGPSRVRPRGHRVTMSDLATCNWRMSQFVQTDCT